MISMILGTISRILNSPYINPSGLLLYSIVLIFLIAGLLHPREFNCLYAGLLYYISVPVAFVLLNIYAIVNLNNISWGTRETKSYMSNQRLSRRKKILDFFFGDSSENKGIYSNILFTPFKYGYNQYITKNLATRDAIAIETLLKVIESKNRSFVESLESLNESLKIEIEKDVVRNWSEHECLGESKMENLDENEEKFFQNLIDKYLYPNLDEQLNKEKVFQGLKELRNNCSYCYLILNGFWLLIMFTLNLLKNKLVDKIYFDLTLNSKYTGKYEPVSFIYVMLFVIILLMQFAAMLWHRVITFTQIIRKTSLRREIQRGPVISHKQNGHVNRDYEEASEQKEKKINDPSDVIITLAL